LHVHTLLQAPFPEHDLDDPGITHGSKTADEELAGAVLAGLHSGEASESLSSFAQSGAHLSMRGDPKHWHGELPAHTVSFLEHSMIFAMQSALGRLHWL
jgi:hypothetical protein